MSMNVYDHLPLYKKSRHCREVAVEFTLNFKNKFYYSKDKMYRLACLMFENCL